MATYEEIYGKRVEVLDADPSLTSAQEGQVWYNSTSGTLKSVVSFASWVSGTNMTQGRTSINGNVGTQTASLIGGGEIPGSPGTNLTEEYNGSGWSSGGNRATSFFRVANFGTQTAAVGFSGYNPSGIPTAPARYSISTEEYDGSSWTAGGSFPEGIQNAGATGTLTAGLQASGIFGPYTTAPSSGWETTCNEYDGSSWTNGTAMPMGRDLSTDIGTLTAALMTCGREGPPGNNIKSTFHYDGSAWTASTDAPTAGHGCMGFGTQTSAILCGGAAPSRSTQSILWDGTSWTTSGSLVTAKVYGMSAGTTAAGMTCAGGTPSVPAGSNITEEYSVSINTLTAAAWASGGAMGTARTGLASAGTQTANVFIGGQMSNSPNAPLNTVELYNGTTWSSNPNNAPYSASNNCGTGTQTAALSWGGYPNVSTTLEFDGTSFSAGGSLSTGRELTSNNIGVQTAAVAAGGYVRSPDTYPTQSEEYNGSAWTAGGAINTPRYSSAGAGTETAGLISGGIEPGQLSNAEEYNGSSWTNVNSRLYTGGNAGTSGTQTASLAYGGNPGSALTTTVSYDGTSWATSPAMAQARAMMGSSAGGTSTAALASSGAAPTATEEFSGGTETVTASTLTTS